MIILGMAQRAVGVTREFVRSLGVGKGFLLYKQGEPKDVTRDKLEKLCIHERRFPAYRVFVAIKKEIKKRSPLKIKFKKQMAVKRRSRCVH